MLWSGEGFPNVPLIGMRDYINYNPVLAIGKLGYPMRGVSSKETIAPFIARGFNEANVKILQRIHKAWNRVERKDKEFRGSSNGIISGYHKWLKSRTQGITWLPKLKSLSGEEAEMPEESEEVQALKAELEKTRVAKEKLKVAVTRVRKECYELKDINMIADEALEQEMKKVRKEEWSRKKF